MDAAIQEKCEAVVRSAGHGDDVGGIVARSVLRSATNGSAGSNDQFRHLACIQRQFHDAHVIHDLADTRVPRFDECGIGLDLDGLGNLADLQQDVDNGIGINLQHDSCLRKRPETGEARL